MTGPTSAGLAYAFNRVHDAEIRLWQTDVLITGRHRVEHEVHHVAQDLATWSRANVERITDLAARYAVPLANVPGPWADNEASCAVSAGGANASIVLLEDLGELLAAALRSSLAWEVLTQLAQATRRADVLSLVSTCHPQVLRHVRWANTMIKTLAPQALASL